MDKSLIRCATYTLNWKSNTIANGTKDNLLETSYKLDKLKAHSGWSYLSVSLCG